MTRRLHWLLLPLLFAACDSEEPVGIGSELLPGDAVNTFVVTLDPADYLLLDTAFAAYGGIEPPTFNILAHDYEGVLNAHTFARFIVPTAISIVDSIGIPRTDSTFAMIRGEILLLPDSLATTGPTPLHVAAYRMGESWDPAFATWQLRSEGEPWTVPGGTPGALVDTAQYVKGDTLRLHVDSATLAAWADTTDPTRGTLISLLQAPARMRTTIPRLRVFARSSWNPDTLFTTISQAPYTRYVYDPRPDTIAGAVRYNGTPTWRSFLRFRSDLADITVSCGPGCTLPLSQADITRAELLLQPETPPPGFTPELATSPVAYSALVTPQIPLARSPLGIAIGTTAAPLTLDDYRDDADPAAVVITQFVRQLVSDTTTDFSTGRSDWLAIIAGTPQTFGFAQFAPGPRLRLVLSTASKVQLP